MKKLHNENRNNPSAPKEVVIFERRKQIYKGMQPLLRVPNKGIEKIIPLIGR